MAATVRIHGDSRGAVRALRQGERATDDYGKSLRRMAGRAAIVALGIVGLGSAVEGARRIIEIGRRSVQEWAKENEEAAGRVRAVSQASDELRFAFAELISTGETGNTVMGTLTALMQSLKGIFDQNNQVIAGLVRGAMRAFLIVLRETVRFGNVLLTALTGLKVSFLVVKATVISVASAFLQVNTAVVRGIIEPVQWAIDALALFTDAMADAIDRIAGERSGLSGPLREANAALVGFSVSVQGAQDFTRELGDRFAQMGIDARAAAAAGINELWVSFIQGASTAEDTITEINRLISSLGQLEIQIDETTASTERNTRATNDNAAALQRAAEAAHRRGLAAAQAVAGRFTDEQARVEAKAESGRRIAFDLEMLRRQQTIDAIKREEDARLALASTAIDTLGAVGQASGKAAKAFQVAQGVALMATAIRGFFEGLVMMARPGQQAQGAIMIGASIKAAVEAANMGASGGPRGGGQGVGGGSTVNQTANVEVTVAGGSGLSDRAISEAVMRGVRSGFIEAVPA